MKQFTRAALSAFMIVLGVALSAFAMSVFVLPFDILAPGVTGLGRTLGIYFGADVSLVVWISNIALLLLGLVVLGWRFAASIVLGSVCFPLFLDLFDAMPWLSAVLSDPLYAAICAGVLEGVGLGLVIRAGGSSGGSDVIPIILNRKFRLPIAPVLYAVDFTIIALQLPASDLESVVRSAIYAALYTVVMDRVILLGRGAVLPGLMSYATFTSVATYSMTTIPLYVLCAQLILEAGVVEDLFNLLYNASKGKRGVLGTFCIVLGAFLGAVCGSGTATSAALGQAAYPQLVKRGYKADLAAAVSAASGSLAGIIPPSVTIIVYGVATETPIGRMFIASMIPGILTTIVFIFCNLFFLNRENRISRQSGEEKAPFEPVPVDKKSTAISAIVAIIIAITIFGGIYSGFMTATEAGAVAATVAFICALLLGKVNKDFLVRAAKSSVKVTAMVMLIIVGAKIFGRFMSLSRISSSFVEMLEPLMDHPEIILIILIIVYFVLFMLMEGTAVIVMTTPVLLPVMEAMEVDMLWFGIIVCFCCVIGQLTPPVGVCVYSACGIADIPVEGPFKYSMLMAIAATVIVGGLMVFFPAVVTWLPSMML